MDEATIDNNNFAIRNNCFDTEKNMVGQIGRLRKTAGSLTGDVKDII